MRNNAHRKYPQCSQPRCGQFSPNKYLALTNHILMLAKNCGSSLSNDSGSVIGQTHSNVHERYSRIGTVVVVCKYSNHEMFNRGNNSRESLLRNFFCRCVQTIEGNMVRNGGRRFDISPFVTCLGCWMRCRAGVKNNTHDEGQLHTNAVNEL